MRAVMEWSTFWHKFAAAGCGVTVTRSRGCWVAGSRGCVVSRFAVARLLGCWVAGSRGRGVARSRGPQASCPADTEDLTIFQPAEQSSNPSNSATWQPANRETAQPRDRDPATPSTQPPCISQRPSPYYVSHLSCDDLSKASRRAFQRMVFSALIVGFRPDSKVSNTQGCFMNSYDAR